MAGNLTNMIASIFSGSAVTADPYFEYTTLLLPGNGTNGAQNNTFLDGSTNNFTITRNGNTTQGTFSPFSQTGWGNYFNGSSTLDTSNAAFNPAGAFTIEFWFYGTDSATATQGLVSTWASGLSPAQGILIWKTGANCEIQIGNASTGGTTIATFTWATYLNQWNHFALVRNSSNSCAVFLNGTRLAAPVTKSGSPGQTALTIGRAFPNSASSYFTGYMSNVSFVSGSNVYDPASSTITVPTTPLSTSTTNQALLTCQANRFIDSNTATTAKTITLTGSPSVQAFSPFNPTASWSAATYGGSGYFDGSGDYLQSANSTAFNLGSNNFTIELWFYTSSTSNQTLISAWNTTSFEIIYFSGTLYCQSNATAPRLTTTSWPLNQWNHIAYVRSGSTYSAYLNGTRFATATDSASIPNVSSGPAIGARQDGTLNFNGYVSNARIVNGTAVYDPTQTTITVPTAPLTAITNTSLLLNFTNAGIYDATSKNDLETVGNAQISTTQSKWGGSSMSFDGTGDSCDIAVSSPFVSDWSGNFTIELWAYTNNLSAQQLIFANVGTNSSGYNSAYINTNGSIGIGRAGINDLSSASSTWTSGQWNHLAYVRNGVNLNIYYNGTSVASTSSASTYLNSTVVGLAIGKNFQTTPAYFNGYIQDFRITKGYARYTSNFTPPTAAFPTL